jgi:hypothetical protein
VLEDKIMDFADRQYQNLERSGLSTWNWRQIRNAFQTAITLAEYQAGQSKATTVTLGKKQFKVVFDASKEFDRYLKKTHKAGDAEMAEDDGLRYDDFDVPKDATRRSNDKPTRQTTGRTYRQVQSDVEDLYDSDPGGDLSLDDMSLTESKSKVKVKAKGRRESFAGVDKNGGKKKRSKVEEIEG